MHSAVRFSFFPNPTPKHFFLPCAPPNNDPPIFITFCGAHFVAVRLKNPLLFPVPSVQADWEIAAEQEAKDWQEKYAKCFELTDTLKALAPPNKYKHY
jgi:hypothetical protein